MKQPKEEIVVTAEEIATLRQLGWEGIIRKAMAYNPVKKKPRNKGRKDK